MNQVDLSDYWSKRYLNNQTGWDCSFITDPLKFYIDQLSDKSIKILIPGCGNGYEGEYLWRNGFINSFILDFAPESIHNLKKRVPDFPDEQIFITDFFEHIGQYDLILEQTMFCAIHPSRRSQYAEKISKLLKPGGKFVGVLFNRDFEGGPPFGGNLIEYQQIFNPYFSVLNFDPCYNSIKPRAGSELFIKLIK